MCHARLSTPFPLCEEMQRPLCPPGKVVMSTASPTKRPLGNSRWSADHSDTTARAEPPSTPTLWELQPQHRVQYHPRTCSCCHTAFHRSCYGLTRDAAAAALARNSWIYRRCTTTPPQLRQGPLQTNRFVSEAANRVNQLALQWNADGLPTKVHELRQRLQLEKIAICLIQETKLTSKDSTPAFSGFSAIRQDRPHHAVEAGYSPW